MKKVLSLMCLLIPSGSLAAVPMTRVIGIINSHTIATESGTIVLRGVDIPSAEESAAKEHLHRLLDGTWVYAEDGDVYRSPDGLYVNAEMQRHAWRSSPGMRYLGEVNPAPRAAVKAAPARVKRPSHFARAGSLSRVRRRSRLR